MRKFLFVLISLFLFSRVYALELKYSEWSLEKNEDILENLIQSENRYKFYKNKEVNVEYLKYEDIKDKYYSLDDYKYTDYEESYDEVIASDHVEVTTKSRTYVFTKEDINSFYLKVRGENKVYVSEIVFTYNNEYYSYESDYNYLNDADYNTYYELDEIFIDFKEKINSNNIKVTLYLKNDPCINEIVEASFLALSRFDVHTYAFRIKEETSIVYVPCDLGFRSSFDPIIYRYRTKLYKTYDLEREYLDGYFTEMDGYIKDKNDYKTYYRYITNEFVILDGEGNLVLDEELCVKEACLLYYLDESKNEVNPKTGNSKIIYLSIFVFVVLVLVLSNRFKKIYN